MSKCYAVSAPCESGTANKTMLNVIGSASIRPMIFHWMTGPVTAPNATDQNYETWIGRTTAAGTTAASPPTPNALDPGDAAAVCTVGHTHSAEPTYAGVPFTKIYVNQRATNQWWANPGGELIGPATAANGIGIKLNAVLAAMVIGSTIHFKE